MSGRSRGQELLRLVRAPVSIILASWPFRRSAWLQRPTDVSEQAHPSERAEMPSAEAADLEADVDELADAMSVSLSIGDAGDRCTARVALGARRGGACGNALPCRLHSRSMAAQPPRPPRPNACAPVAGSEGCEAVCALGARAGSRCGAQLPCRLHPATTTPTKPSRSSAVLRSPVASPIGGCALDEEPAHLADDGDTSRMCSAVIAHGKRKGKQCCIALPCRYHSQRMHPVSPQPAGRLPRPPADENNSPPSQTSQSSLTLSARKTKVTVRLVDKGAQQLIRTALDELLRDSALRRRALPLLRTTHGDGCYYLRHTEARHVSLAVQTKDAQVDHTFECQLIAHAVVQCPEYAEILRQFDVNTKNTIAQQPFVVQNALRPVYDVQNNVDQSDLFNLKLLNPNLNITKRFAYTNFLKRVYDVRRGEYNLSNDMERLMSKHSSAEDAVVLTRSLLTELRGVEEPYVLALQSMCGDYLGGKRSNVSDRARLESRLSALGETVKQVFGDINDLS